ncbi:MAG: sulfotransferase [Henriciella sp.]|nr:sulfotransferase [Henriciella sp.]
MAAEQDKPQGIIILGAPRSGTTLLRRILGAHPNIAAPGETYALSAGARFLSSDPSIDGMQVGVVNGLGFLGVEEEELTLRLRNFIFGFLNDYAAREGKTRWVEKTAIDAFHIEGIERFCGDDAQFLCVTRHGLDVVCSMEEWCQKSGSYPRELHAYIRQHSQPLVAFAHAWVDATNTLLDFAERHPDNAMPVRYEDLIASPEDYVAKLMSFLGETAPEGLLETALSDTDARGFSDWKTFSKSSIEKSSVNRWRRLPRATLQELAQIVNNTLERCGYDPLSIKFEDSDENARRRYETGLKLQSLKS